MNNRMHLLNAAPPPAKTTTAPVTAKFNWVESKISGERMQAAGDNLMTKIIGLSAKLRNFAHVNIGDLLADLEAVEGLIASLKKMLAEHKARTNNSPEVGIIESLLREAEEHHASLGEQIKDTYSEVEPWQK
ncbi:MAG: hypothetical protein PHV02_16035 [Rhodocyclaceae bacterium]|nr:hypothetical protein [Rhodocyclaceae bacterium]